MEVKQIITNNRVEIILLSYALMAALSFVIPNPPTTFIVLLLIVSVLWVLFVSFFPLIFLREETLRRQQELYDKYDIHPSTKMEDIPRRIRIIINVVLLIVLVALFIRALNRLPFKLF